MQISHIPFLHAEVSRSDAPLWMLMKPHHVYISPCIEALSCICLDISGEATGAGQCCCCCCCCVNQGATCLVLLCSLMAGVRAAGLMKAALMKGQESAGGTADRRTQGWCPRAGRTLVILITRSFEGGPRGRAQADDMRVCRYLVQCMRRYGSSGGLKESPRSLPLAPRHMRLTPPGLAPQQSGSERVCSH